MTRRKLRFGLITLLVLCMGVVFVGGGQYLASLRNNLTDQAISNVMTVTKQQQQAFDNFIAGDRERIHSFAEYFSQHEYGDPLEVQRYLTLFHDVDADYSVICIEDGWYCSNASEEILWLDEEDKVYYETFSGSGIRDVYTGIFSGKPMFGYYEVFEFVGGHHGVIQKSYDRTKVMDTFSLSFYNDQGLAYVVNQEGDILLHSNGMLGDHIYDNILDIGENGSDDEEAKKDAFLDAINNQESGNMILEFEDDDFLYTYVPVENVEGWYLVSIVRMSAIVAETEQTLKESQVAVAVLVSIVVICSIALVLIWYTRQDIAARDKKIRYQEETFNIFATYLADNVNDVYLLLDLEKKQVEYVSPNVERVIGIPPEKISADIRAFAGTGGMSSGRVDVDALYDLKPGESLGPITVNWENNRTREPRWFKISFYCTEIQEENKVVLYISDRTEERKSQDALTEALNMAQVANEAKSTFLGNMSHDIRTPMNAIIGLVTLLRSEAGNPDVVLEYTQRIDAASQHLLSLINDVLDMNKIESSSATLNLAEMDMAEIIDEINTIIRPQAKAKKQTFDIFVSALIYEHLMADKLRINQVLINLLSNAVKYTPAGGRIEMRVEELPQVVKRYSHIRFTIRDNGMGMGEDYLKVIFDPFTREETSAKSQIQGTGLGMAITKRLVDLMGGSIEVESKLGKGTTFTVELDLHIHEREDDPEFWKDHKVFRMIVADDEEEVCHSIVKTMEKAGVVTDYSTDGQSAVSMMRRAREEGRPYDLILLDWKMPDLNGLETARLIRKNYPERIPILLLTAYDWEEVEQEAREIGVNHFMPKPFFMSTFKEAIRRVMGDQKKIETEDSSIVNGKKILVVDDIEVNRLILVKILHSLGASCDVAGNGQEAVDLFESSEEGEYDLILMDIQMPVMDGYTATRTIRAGDHPSARTMPIIAMTANAFVDDVKDAIESGMDAHVAKPVQIDKLRATIQQVLEGRSGRS